MTSMGRGGFRWKKLCQLVYATYGPVCYLCEHGIPGGLRTGQVDHVIAVSEDPSLRFELSNLRPVHGGRYPCPLCGHKCNQVKAGRSLMYAQRVLKTPKPGFRGSPLGVKRREPGREWLFPVAPRLVLLVLAFENPGRVVSPPPLALPAAAQARRPRRALAQRGRTVGPFGVSFHARSRLARSLSQASSA